VDLNPVRAGLVGEPVPYPWSSAAAHVTGQDTAGLLDEWEWSELGFQQDWKRLLGAPEWRLWKSGAWAPILVRPPKDLRNPTQRGPTLSAPCSPIQSHPHQPHRTNNIPQKTTERFGTVCYPPSEGRSTPFNRADQPINRSTDQRIIDQRKCVHGTAQNRSLRPGKPTANAPCQSAGPAP
jgi:hypothetical protein